MSFWFCNKFPAISLCLVIELADEQCIELKFRPKVFINNTQSPVCQRVYEFMIETDHIILLKFEDVDIVFEDDKWNRVDVSYADHITNKKVSIRRVARSSGIHVLASDLGDVQFSPPQNKLHVIQTEGPQKIAKVKISS